MPGEDNRAWPGNLKSGFTFWFVYTLKQMGLEVEVEQLWGSYRRDILGSYRRDILGELSSVPCRLDSVTASSVVQGAGQSKIWVGIGH